MFYRLIKFSTRITKPFHYINYFTSNFHTMGILEALCLQTEKTKIKSTKQKTGSFIVSHPKSFSIVSEYI